MSLRWRFNRQAVQHVSRIGTASALHFSDVIAEAELQENAELQALGTFAAAVNELARKCQTKPFPDKLAIADAFDLGVEAGLWSEDPAALKARLARAAREGLVDLERCDVVGAMSSELLNRSRLQLGRDERHLVVMSV
jgi:hypothetical protein